MKDLVIVFPGQGSQFAGMGKKWFDGHESVRDRFAQASDIVGYSLADLCFTAPPAEVTRTRYAQVSLLVLSYAMYEVMTEGRKIPVSSMTGHSLGEITALAAAGALSFEDAVRLVKVRGEAMESCVAEGGTGMIAAVRMPVTDVEKCVEDFNSAGHTVQVANYNAETQTVLSGTVDDLKGMTAHLEDRGAKVVKLNVAGAFHSTFMANALPEYTKALDAVEFAEPAVPVYSNVTGEVYESPEAIREALAVQLTSPVRWSAIVSSLVERKAAVWIEVGPKQVLKKMLTGAVGSGEVYSLDEEPEQVHAVLDQLVELKKREPGLVGLFLGAAAATRNRNFDAEEYDEGVVASYRKLQELAKLDPEALTDEQKQTALDLLLTIMRTKRVPEDEQLDRVESILRRTGDVGLRTIAGALAT
ncbi:[acyl-carrier-protein] S-malonyltransferase [Saccharothrix carnea]|uniref:[acyl-carrier-protein] S-malonyltransferase n=1 Tax=Saccharothrix carnea TaxID=1280637 RepID=A0A2P8IBE6_SACCR|nr:ACP S-malonyltransferase [Saccharothrix carnea]PSL55788.1 [acyl-carrier-protein] S-malonyltransferase [Saccharothrix carnea]